MWGVDYDEESKRREVILREKVFVGHRIFEEAKPALRKLSKGYKLVIVSSRGPSVQKDSTDWIKKEFGPIFSDFKFARYFEDSTLHPLQKLKMTKVEMLKDAGADYLIDDHPKHCVAAADVGITALLFGDYRWTRGVKLRPNLVRARDWQEVLEYFDGRG